MHDEPRGGTLRRSVGYLLTCPYCFGVWSSTGLATALLVRPGQTRLSLHMLAADTVSDFLHLGSVRLNEQRRRVAAERRIRPTSATHLPGESNAK